jgi:hypothetical protein
MMMLPKTPKKKILEKTVFIFAVKNAETRIM